MMILPDTKELYFKIAYCGPSLSGISTNLEKIHLKVNPESDKSIKVSRIYNDETIIFDFTTLRMNEYNGFIPVFEIYGFSDCENWHAIRDVLLKDVDGIVFIADSQPARLEENIEVFNKLKSMVEEVGDQFHNTPFVLQCNKQDSSLALPPEIIKQKLSEKDLSYFSAIATRGVGVFETLKEVILRLSRIVSPFEQRTAGV
jgi:signal recognition particle receptor subunit beta